MCVKSHFRTCDVRAEVRAERFLELCVRCVCVLLVLGVRCAIALLHTFLNKMTRFPVSEHYFSNLAHPFLFSNILFLFLNILFCFRTVYSDLEHPKICSNNIDLQKLHVKVQFFLKEIWKKCECGCDHRKLRCGAKVRADQLLKCGCACATQQNFSQPNVC